ncbi:hypothetical protein D3C71_1780040 [compost metagenome]
MKLNALGIDVLPAHDAAPIGVVPDNNGFGGVLVQDVGVGDLRIEIGFGQGGAGHTGGQQTGHSKARLQVFRHLFPPNLRHHDANLSR